MVLPDHRHYIRALAPNDADLDRPVEYIRYNPVKYGYPTPPMDSPDSRIRTLVEAGIHPAGRGRIEMNFEAVGNE